MNSSPVQTSTSTCVMSWRVGVTVCLVLSGTGLGCERDDVSSRQTCPGCSIVLRHVVTLGRLEDDASITTFSVVARDSRGRYFVAPTATPGAVAVFSPHGDLIRSIARSGQGPGELGRIRNIAVTPGDSLLVLDGQRLTLFAPQGGFVRTAQLPAGVRSFRFLVLRDGRVVVNNYFPTHPAFVVLSPEFSEIRTWGREIAGGDSDSLQYRLALLTTGEVVAAQANYGYVIEVWDTTGILKHRFRRTVDWFPAWESQPLVHAAPDESRPPPRITAVATDALGRVWVCALVADANWVGRARSQGGRGDGLPLVPLDDFPRIYDTVIEVLDVSHGRVVVTQRFDEVVKFLDNGFVYALHSEPSGLIRIAVWRPEIVAPGAGDR